MRRAAAVGACAIAAGGLVARAALGHDPFQITSTARVHRDRIDVRVTMYERTAAQICLEGAPAAHLDAARFEASRAQFDACAPRLFDVTAHGRKLVPSAASASLTAENDVDFSVTYPPAAAPPLVFDAVHLRRLSNPTYGAELTVTGDGVFLGQALLRADESTLTIDGLSPPSETVSSVPGAAPAPPQPSFGAYLRLGIEHILTGYDHLLFLAGLLVACRTFRSVLAIVSAFTVAHSITLALAARDVFSLPGRLVEPLIAATIVFVGVENLARGEEPKGRWLLAFAFGLVHGFGFAGALRQIGLGANGAPFVLPLLSFNLGVEIGQIAVAAALLPVLFKLRAVPAFARYGTRAVSLLVSGVGLYWLLQRTVLS
jgi:hypothetical protein